MAFYATAETYVPDGLPLAEACARTTHLAIAAHQDDIEIMAAHGVLAGFGRSDAWFGGVIVTNGAGSPRDDLYVSYTDDEMRAVRRVEQKKAAFVGEYSMQAFLDFTSSDIKKDRIAEATDDIYQLLLATRPSVVYTHNLADKHPTHVAVALRTLAALRRLPADARPEKVLGCEVWRGLDWMLDSDKVALDVSAHENITLSILGVFDSQICGGKRYDLATVGRRRANATYFESHGTDEFSQLNFAMDLTPLVNDPALDPVAYVQSYIDRFAADVAQRLAEVAGVKV
jgi:LmbE family N-acetylglucosaminyl deacetylase